MQQRIVVSVEETDDDGNVTQTEMMGMSVKSLFQALGGLDKIAPEAYAELKKSAEELRLRVERPSFVGTPSSYIEPSHATALVLASINMRENTSMYAAAVMMLEPQTGAMSIQEIADIITTPELALVKAGVSFEGVRSTINKAKAALGDLVEVSPGRPDGYKGRPPMFIYPTGARPKWLDNN
jgi:hypothetical protein